MASSMSLHLLLPNTPFNHKRYTNNSFYLCSSQFVSPKSLTRLKKELLLSNKKKLRIHRRSHSVPVVALQSNFFRVLQTVAKVGKDGIDAGTNLVPDSVPRPIARISVAVVAGAVSLFVLKSFLSTAFFVAAMMGLIYFIFIALNKDEGPRGGGGTTTTEDSLEEARKIMEKYK